MIKATVIKRIVSLPERKEEESAEQRERRLFGIAIYSALIQMAKAFRRRYVGDEPRCPHCASKL